MNNPMSEDFTSGMGLFIKYKNHKTCNLTIRMQELKSLFSEIKNKLYNPLLTIDKDLVERILELVKFSFKLYKIREIFKEQILWPYFGTTMQFQNISYNDAVIDQVDKLYFFKDSGLYYMSILESVEKLIDYTDDQKNEKDLNKIKDILQNILNKI